LTGNQPNELIRLWEFSPNDKWSLLYRGTRDGFGAQDFHSKCDNKSPTLSICKAHESSYIFGGFTTVSWDSTSQWKSDPSAFLFSLTNKDNKPLKMKIDPNSHQYAIYCHSTIGPIYGFSGDLCIANNANTTMDKFSNFQLDEIEVYQKEELRKRKKYLIKLDFLKTLLDIEFFHFFK
jgi:hypothetical protein